MQESEFGDKVDVVLGSGGKKSALSILGVLGIIALWTIVCSLHIIPPLLLPSPSRVLLAAADIGPDLFKHIGATTARVVSGFLLGGIAGIGVGVSMQYDRRVFLLLDGIVETARPVPPVALVPFFLLWFGFSEPGKILLVAMGTSLVIIVAVVEALERVPTGVVRWGLVMGLPRRDLFKLILLRSALPEMRAGFRIALALAVTLVVVSEFMGATYGVGYLINVSKVTLNTPTVVLSIIVLGWLAYLLDRMLRWFFDKSCSWDVRAKGATR